MSKMLICSILIVLFSFGLAICGSESDPVAEYYLNQADSAMEQYYLFRTESQFSFVLTSVFKMTDYHGTLEDIDTAMYEIIMSNGKIDSVSIIDSSKSDNNKLPDNFDFLSPWIENCNKFFFPNDTGAGRLAVGFESLDSTLGKVFSGIANIDRDSSRPENIMVSYINTDDFNRLSKSWYFDYLGLYIVLTKQETQTVKSGFLGKEYFYRLLKFSDYKFE